MTDIITQVNKRIKKVFRLPLPGWVKLEVIVSIATFFLLAAWFYMDIFHHAPVVCL